MTKKKLFLYLLFLVGMAQSAMAQEPYAVLSDDGTMLTFYYDMQKAERGGKSVGPFNYFDVQPSWYPQRETIATVVFDASFADCTSLTSTAYWFDGCTKLNTISGIENLKTDNVTDMSSMFNGCSSLTSLDLSGFKTDNVTGTDMSMMFYGCSSLTSLDLSSFRTDNVTYMSHMFNGCSSLTSLDLSSFRTDNVTDMMMMFYGCSSLTSLDLSSFSTDNVTDMIGMFYGCSSLTSLDLSSFKTDNVTNMVSMFRDCSSLTSLDLNGFKTDNVADMLCMFEGCSSLTSLDLSSFKTDKVTNMNSMFWGCSSLTTIYASKNWSTENVITGVGMFIKCTNLVGGQGTAYDAIRSHTNYTYARIDGGTAAPGYFTEKSGTGIHGLNADSNADNAPVYNLSGRRVQVPAKGIYVKVGKKFVNK